ncbi:SGNH/GDSL hydrolase family protein [Actinomyces bowdenii]|uniref:SGNH/GDSL hydrolase family protein n=1 Tax=Actinomyces bowdenii TaxID=131109 RepID=A0A3P1UZE9_9ACTO|nr:SGNH/GDSL hydrolase family protein [Actinomyces bowdenii]RRD26700.1 SGNH/GDSL hydrolase family protein [Actinomyces bowdenii]
MPSIPHSADPLTAVFLGDSSTTGWRSVSHPRQRWTSLVCEHNRWREVNLAVDGLGYFARRGGRLPGGGRAPSCRDTTWLEAVLRTEPDLVTVGLGLNDAAFLPSQGELVEQAIAHDLDFLSSRLPGTQVVIAPYFPTITAGPRFQAIRRMIHEHATAMGLASTDALIMAIGGDEDKLCLDAIHPNDQGHAAMARSMLPVYADLLPQD